MSSFALQVPTGDSPEGPHLNDKTVIATYVPGSMDTLCVHRETSGDKKGWRVTHTSTRRAVLGQSFKTKEIAIEVGRILYALQPMLWDEEFPSIHEALSSVRSVANLYRRRPKIVKLPPLEPPTHE